MCYERRRAEACVDESAHHALANAGGREIVGKKEGEQKGSGRGSVHWGCYYATALDIEVDPQRCVFITAGPITKLFAGEEEESGGHVLFCDFVTLCSW